MRIHGRAGKRRRRTKADDMEKLTVRIFVLIGNNNTHYACLWLLIQVLD